MDERFKQVLTDPRFKTLKKSQRKVRIDGRFQQMFTDKKFGTKSDVDPRFGKVQQEECASDKTLESFYDTSHCSAPADPSLLRGGPPQQEHDASSSSDESSDEDDEAQVDHNWAELDKDVSRSHDTSQRLAVCNVDWDRIKAADLFVLLNSFKPGAGSITSIKVFASEFGKKRMAEEAIRGPAEIASTPVVDDDSVTEHESGDALEDEYMQEQLRQYQLNRLKYYYAIVECDSDATANSLYEQLDNYEFESSASSLDLRFVPDTETFDDQDAVQLCTSLPDSATYKAPIFITSALQQSSVRLTWDETDPSRVQKIESAFASRDEQQIDDLQAFLASGESASSDEESDEQVPVPDTESPLPTKLNKYKQLLQAVEDENKNGDADMEITFDDPDSDQETGSGADRRDVGTSTDNESEASEVSDGNKGPGGRKTGGAEANVELDLLVEEGKSHFNFADFIDDGKKRKKRKAPPAPTAEDFEFDGRDPRFTRIFSSPDYNIDPSNPHFKKTPGMISLLQQKANIAMSAATRKRK